MFKYIFWAFAICAVLASCTAEITVETTAETTAEPTAETTVETTVETTAETTAETTVETTVETTAETTAETTVVTTAATTALPKSKFAPTVLDGEYTYGGEPIIENIDGITYVNGILVANKTYALPDDFNPGGIHPEAQAAFDAMKADAAAEGLRLRIVSGYRSYRQQTKTYGNYVNRDGQALADTYSARPGHSEHQSGLAMDINSVYNSFADTPEGVWLAQNCAKYGFIIRYPKGKDDITGYMYEPWHIRYVGKELAGIITDSGLCLEEFLNITSVYSE